MRIVIMALVVGLATGTRAAEQDGAPAERPPTLILAYKRDASGSIQGICHPGEKKTLVCDFTEVMFLRPYAKSADAQERQMLSAVRGDPGKAKEEMQATAAQMREARERSDAALGPKGKQDFDNVLRAAESGDPERLARALTERARHRCHLFVFTYAPKFHRAGVRKWVSEKTPEGPCHTVQVWELSSDDEQSLVWNIRSTTVDAGNTEGPCAPLAKEVDEVTEWNATNPKEYEPPCDYVTYFQ